MVDGEVRAGGSEGCGAQAEGAAKGAGSAGSGGFDIDVGVADHHGLRGDGFGGGYEGQQAFGIWFLGGERVAAVVGEEETVEAEVLANVA